MVSSEDTVTSIILKNDSGDGDDNGRRSQQINNVDADDDGNEQKIGYSRTSRLKEENAEERTGH
jgi:hypothetical protein